MAVEILILSGARAGQQIVITGSEFRAGTASDCEVCFDPRHDPTAMEGSVVFRFMEDGWYAQPTGRGEIFVNQDPLAGRIRLRSGDVVRMSHQGPDFSLTIGAHAAATVASQGPMAQATPVPAVEPILPLVGPAAAPFASLAAVPVAAPLVSVAAAKETMSPAPSPPAGGKQWRRLAWIGGVVAIALILLLLVKSVLTRPPKLGEIEDQKAIQGQELQLSLPLIDRGSFPDKLQFRLNSPVPLGARINAEKELFTWNVPNDQAAGPYSITVQVAVAGREDLASTATFVVQVNKRQVKPPVLGKIEDQKVIPGQTLHLPITLIDRGSFPDELHFRVNSPLPRGARIDVDTGLFTWIVPDDQAAGPYSITVQVAVAGREDLASTATFVIQIEGQTPISEDPKIRDAVYLVELEIYKQLIPFATCCAINEKTLLTSAREAAQLVSYRNEGLEHRIWICNEKGVKREVEEIRALRAFTPLFREGTRLETGKSARGQEEPAAENNCPKWIYFDLALLTVEQKLPTFVPLASSEELKSLEKGLPLLCLGYAHDTKIISKYNMPKLQSGKGNSIYLIANLPPSNPSADEPPRLLHMDGEIPTQWVDDPSAKRKVAIRPYGSPVFNLQGKLVAVYGDTPPPPKGEESLLLHYAPVISPKLIDDWLRGEANQTEDTETWTLPGLLPPPESPRKP
jgi:hypothetical protein